MTVVVAVMTVVVVAMMMIHHRRRPDGHGPFPFPFPFRPALEPWKPYDVVCVCMCDRRRERRG